MHAELCSKTDQGGPIPGSDQHLIAARLASLADPTVLKADSCPDCHVALSFGDRQHPNSGQLVLATAAGPQAAVGPSDCHSGEGGDSIREGDTTAFVLVLYLS